MELTLIESNLAMLNEGEKSGDFKGIIATLDGEQTDCWRSDWLPIAEDIGGDYACLELAGKSRGPATTQAAGDDRAEIRRAMKQMRIWTTAQVMVPLDECGGHKAGE